VVRDIDYTAVSNTDTAAATVTIQFNDNGTFYEQVKATLQVGQQLVYTHARGWNVANVPSTSVLAFGLYASRPSAVTAGVGALYYATDVSEEYLSTGAAWTVVSGGAELGYAEISTPFTTASATFVDVTGLSFTAKVGERPLILEMEGHVRNTAGVGSAAIFALVANGTMRQGEKVFFVAGTGATYQTAYARARIAGLTPGVTYTFKLQIRATAAGTAEIYGDASWQSFLRLTAE
jgi:hypothetical protein